MFVGMICFSIVLIVFFKWTCVKNPVSAYANLGQVVSFHVGPNHRAV